MEQPATADPLIGATIGNYEIRSKLGEGGMGAVYMAEHPHIGKRVALKVLHAEFSSKEDVVKRFFQEAKAVNDVQHPNIVDIIDYGWIPNKQGLNTVYFIMEFLDGPSLSDVIRSQAPLAPERALAIGLQIADALGACHKSGVVHRDLKPDNIILIQRGREPDFVKVLDFGIAKLTGDQKVSVRTRTGLLMGTPSYMSPEQCEGSATVDHRTDIYALGVLLYEMLTGKPPFVGETYGQILIQHLTQVPTPLSMVHGLIPPHVEAVVLKALEKNPDARYQTMEELVQALADPVGYVELHGGLSGFMGRDAMGRPLTTSISVFTPSGQVIQVPTSMISTPMLPLERPRRGRRIAITAITALLLALGGAGLWWKYQQDIADAAASNVPTHHVPPVVIPTGEPVVGSEPGAGTEPGEAADPGQPAAGEATAQADPASDPAPAEPAAVESVAVRVLSQPEGAAVFFDDESKPRGKTPLTLSVPRGTAEVSVTLRLDGYRDVVRSFVPDNNKEYDLQLRRERRAGVRDSVARTPIRKPRDEPKDPKRPTPDDPKNPKRTDKDKIQEDVGLEDPF
jgi:serine/threonine-protein kinase